jgi:diguanylate cyclase (GGDEF)-like protein/PAS domain S-box-containing protein
VQGIAELPYRILALDADAEARRVYAALFASGAPGDAALDGLAPAPFELVVADGPDSAVRALRDALAHGRPCHAAFIEARAADDWSGLRSAQVLRALDPNLYLVIACEDPDERLAARLVSLGDNLAMLRKPLLGIEAQRLAMALRRAWLADKRLERVTSDMEHQAFAQATELDKRVTQQQALAEIATRCVELAEDDDLDDAVHWSLARIGKVTGADRVGLIRLDADLATFVMSHEWRALGVVEPRGAARGLAVARIRSTHAYLRRGGRFRFAAADAAPEDMTVLLDFIRGPGESVSSVPIMSRDQVAGMLSIAAAQGDNPWDSHDEALLRTAGHLIMRTLEATEAKRRLALSEANFRALVENIPGSVYRCALDEQWTIKFMSKYIETLTGYPLADFIDNRVRSYASIIHPDDVEHVDAVVRAAVAARQPYVLQYRIMHADGRPRWVYERGRAAYDARGRVSWLEGVIADDTERKEAEKALHVALTKLKTLFDNFPTGITVTDAQGHIVESNPAAERLLGVPRDTQNQRDIDAPEWRIVRTDGTPMPAEEYASVRALREQRRVDDVEMGIVKPDGTTWINVSADILPIEGYGVVITYNDITARREAEEKIRDMAYRDALTGVPNRRLLMDRLGQALHASQRSGEYGALLILDLDKFKGVNDSLGHDAGDALLIEVARRLQANVRNTDTVARLGGDEYVVLLVELGAEEGAALRHGMLIAEKIRESLARPYDLPGADAPQACSASIGLALYRGREQPPEAILKQADLALYRAKSEGRDQVRG